MTSKLGDIQLDPGWWRRTAVIVMRLAFVLFLLWALLSGKISTPTPVAGDNPTSNPDSRSATEPCSSSEDRLG